MSVFLIADDSDAKALMLKAMVEQSGIAEKILHARTTDEAKELINAEQIAYAFIDYEMPTEEGPAVIAYLKQNQPNCKVAMVTSGNSAYYRDGATNAGADAFICTSFASDEVEEAIEKLLESWLL